ncbi:S8 family serine peptidase [Shimia sp.]|uniref:S8 family serine peptidase n=1 Tax=Shimia sp. TaxID=1954381 RepID=UPI003BACCA09
MSRLIGVLLGALLLTACVGSRPSTVARADVRDTRELIVMVAGAPDELISNAENLGYVTRSVRPLEELGDVLVAFTIPEGLSIPEAITQIEEAVPGVTAGAHHVYRLQANPFTASGANYANGLIGWRDDGCRAVRRVGLIDKALPQAHEHLASGRVVQNSFVAPQPPANAEHGAQMASLLIGEGRLSDTVLFSAGVVEQGPDGETTAGVSAMLEAVNWLAQQDVEVVNISLAGPRNKLLNRGMERAASDGMIFVAAAGNQGASAPPQFPAAFPYVVAVTAVDSALEVYDRAVQGAQIDVAAPGVDILVQDSTGTRILSGTSAATPFVTASIAANSGWKELSVAEVKEDLRTITRDIGAPGQDDVFGQGLIQAPAACR